MAHRRCRRVDLTHPVTNMEHGKAVRVPPALAVPRQVYRKANPGETAMRGSNKPTPFCNRADMPTSIGSLFARESVEPSTQRKANDDGSSRINWCVLACQKPGVGLA